MCDLISNTCEFCLSWCGGQFLLFKILLHNSLISNLIIINIFKMKLNLNYNNQENNFNIFINKKVFKYPFIFFLNDIIYYY